MVSVPERGIRRVMHCDLDCFYAAAEELDHPSLRGKPVIVGGDPDRRGVVSTANYVARRYGVRSAMAAALARRLCPEAIFLRPRFERYRELSRRVMEILGEYFLAFEQVSIDEAYGELPPAAPGCRPAEEIGREIKARVRAETGLIVSVGAGRTKSLAKLASDLSKPDGCLVVRPGSERAFLAPLPVGVLPGVGPHTRERLAKLGVTTVGDLAAWTQLESSQRFGKHGFWLWQLANGQDDRPVVSDHGPPKSISHERTFARDIADGERALEQVRALARAVAERASEKHHQGRSVTLKVRWADFSLMTRQHSFAEPIGDEQAIAVAAQQLLIAEVAPLLGPEHAIRLLGVALGNIISPETSARVLRVPGYVQPTLWERAAS
jgi:DNA polymerase IV